MPLLSGLWFGLTKEILVQKEISEYPKESAKAFFQLICPNICKNFHLRNSTIPEKSTQK